MKKVFGGIAANIVSPPLRGLLPLTALLLSLPEIGKCEGCDFGSCERVPMNEIANKAKNGDCSCQFYENAVAGFGRKPLPYDVSAYKAELEAKAAHGDSYAQRTLGDGYRFGYFGKKDGKAAAKYYSQSAEAGDTTAMNYLAALYSTGLPDVPVDYDLAKKWYARAATPRAGGYMLILSQRLARGELGPPNKAEAYAWVLLAEKFTGDGTPTPYDDYIAELRKTLSEQDLQSAAKRQSALEKEYFQGIAPSPKLSEAELRQREEHRKELAEKLGKMSHAELQEEIDKTLKEWRAQRAKK